PLLIPHRLPDGSAVQIVEDRSRRLGNHSLNFGVALVVVHLEVRFRLFQRNQVHASTSSRLIFGKASNALPGVQLMISAPRFLSAPNRSIHTRNFCSFGLPSARPSAFFV